MFWNIFISAKPLEVKPSKGLTLIEEKNNPRENAGMSNEKGITLA